METIVCPNCRKLTGHKRSLGFGTFFAVLITFGFWLLVLPLYPKRCVACGLAKTSKISGPVKWIGFGFAAFVLLLFFGVLRIFHTRRASDPEVRSSGTATHGDVEILAVRTLHRMSTAPFVGPYRRYQGYLPKTADGDFKTAYAKAFNADIPPSFSAQNEWMLTLSGTMEPSQMVEIEGEKYLWSHACRPHLCPEANIYLLYDPRKKVAWGVAQSDATSHVFGAPSELQSAILLDLVALNYLNLDESLPVSASAAIALEGAIHESRGDVLHMMSLLPDLEAKWSAANVKNKESVVGGLHSNESTQEMHEQKIKDLLSEQEFNNTLLAVAQRTIHSGLKPGDQLYISDEGLARLLQKRDDIKRALAEEEAKGGNGETGISSANPAEVSAVHYDLQSDSANPGQNQPGATDFPAKILNLPVDQRTRAEDFRTIRSFISSKGGQFENRPLEESVMYGDVNHDSVADAVITYIVRDGNAAEEFLAVLIRSDGNLTYSTEMSLGVAGSDASLKAISNNMIYLDTLTMGPNDPTCCPSVKGVLRIKLINGKLVQSER